MLDSPRCRDWTPLATQQLRLRSLIQIVGYNIRPPECCPRLPVDTCTYYYTLHETVHSAPLYTSEKIASPHPKWREIAGVTHRRASTNVIVRIWWHAQADPQRTRPQDTVVQTWGVYLSGLRLIGANPALDFTADSFKANTLVFQLHGGYFCSYKSLNLDSIPTENLYEYSVSSGSSAASSNIPIEANYLQHHRIIKESRSISPNKGRNFKTDEYSKSHSPTERGFKQNCTRLRPSQSVNIHRLDAGVEEEDGLLEVRVYSSSETNCARLDNIGPAPDIPKCRYLALNFLKSEVRPSYSASKLQELHLLQYAIKKRQDGVQEIKEKIYKKSAIEADEAAPRLRASRNNLFSEENEIQEPERAQSHPPVITAPRPALKLNDLLSMQTRPSPYERLAHARLTRQMEVLRFKRLLLTDERDAKMVAIRRLKQRLSKITEDNQDIGSELMTGYHALARRGERLRQARQSCAALRELCARSAVALHHSQARHLTRLEDVFPIKHEGSRWSICGCVLPIFDDDAPRRPATFTDAVAAGFAAQCCQVAAMLLCRPLRYPIRVCGSTTHILDHLTPELPDPRIPLYPRGGDSAMFRYGMFLLNKNCAQLVWERGLGVSDVRPTLHNLSRLLREHRTRSETSMLSSDTCGASLRSLIASERLQLRQFNRFKDAGDVRTHRHCRSAGSYTEQTDERMATLSMGSDPLLHEADAATTLNKHNSDSQISRLSTDTRRALFTLGDDTEPLVIKVTSSNGNGVAHLQGDCGHDRSHQANSDTILMEPQSNIKERQSAELVSESSSLASEDSRADEVSGREQLDPQTNSELLEKNVPNEHERQPSISEEVVAIQHADIDTNNEGCDCRKDCGSPELCSQVDSL